MKKIITFLVLTIMCFVSVKTYAHEELPYNKQGIGLNLLDPQYFEKTSNTHLEYNAWIDVDLDFGYTILFRGIESADPGATIDVEFETGQTASFKRREELELIFDIKLNQVDYSSMPNYFRISSINCKEITEKPIEYIKNNVTMYYSGYEDFYTKYFYDENYNNKVENPTIITSVDDKVDVDKLFSKFIVRHETYNVDVKKTDVDDYEHKYNIPGVYEYKYELSTKGSCCTKGIKILVFKPDEPILEGPKEWLIYSDEALCGGYTTKEYFDSYYDLKYGSRETTLEYKLVDKDNKEYLLSEISNGDGEYKLIVTGKYKGQQIAYLEAKFVVIDDSPIEVFNPNFLINITDAKNYSNEQLCDYLDTLLKMNDVYAKDLTILSSTYKGNEKVEGMYEINYSYKVGDRIEFAKASINVSKNNKDEILEVNNKISKENTDYTQVIISSIFLIISLSILTYIVIDKHKNRKNNL